MGFPARAVPPSSPDLCFQGLRNQEMGKKNLPPSAGEETLISVRYFCAQCFVYTAEDDHKLTFKMQRIL